MAKIHVDTYDASMPIQLSDMSLGGMILNVEQRGGKMKLIAARFTTCKTVNSTKKMSQFA